MHAMRDIHGCTRKIYSEDPKMVKQIVSGCPEENKSEMKSNQVQPCMSRIDICDDYDDVDIERHIFPFN